MLFIVRGEPAAPAAHDESHFQDGGTARPSQSTNLNPGVIYQGGGGWSGSVSRSLRSPVVPARAAPEKARGEPARAADNWGALGDGDGAEGSRSRATGAE